MVNRTGSFNRKFTKRLKNIRDRKKNRYNRVKQMRTNAEREEEIQHIPVHKMKSVKRVKKEAKKQTNIEKIYRELALTNSRSVIKDKHSIKRRNRRGGKRGNQHTTNMDID